MVELLRNPRRLLLFCFEGALVAVLVMFAGCMRLGVHAGLTYPHVAKRALLFALVMQGCFYYSGLYDFNVAHTTRSAYIRVLQALALGSVLLFPFWYLIPSLRLGRGVFLAGAALVAIILPTWRTIYERISTNEEFFRRALILGNGALAHELAEMIRDRSDLGLELVGMLARDRIRVDPARLVVGTYGELFQIVSSLNVQLVLVAYPDRRGTLPVEQLLEVKFRGVEVEEGVHFYERNNSKLYVRELKPSQLIFADGFASRPGTRRLKRILDVAVSVLGLLLAAPLMFLTSLAIKLESPGPMLYAQVRAGEFGKLFTIYKFRSMRTDAEKAGAQFAQENDPRVTRVGKFIRKTRLDELPQLWNVLRGDMSMVGPRPERPVFIEQLEQQVPFFKQRLYVRPGLTGHAQVRCRYGASAEDMVEKLQYDLYYIKSYNLVFDLSIMVDTIKVVLLRIGSR